MRIVHSHRRKVAEFSHAIIRLLLSLALLAVLALSDAPPMRTARAGINEWTTNGPDGGPVLALVIDPHIPTTLYAGTAGGVYKSTDGGASWNAASIGIAEQGIEAMAIDPQTPTTVYAATSDSVYKSTDGGAHWNGINNGFELLIGSNIQDIVVDPTNPNVLFAATLGIATGGGVYKSIDGGAQWTRSGLGLDKLFLYSLAINPVNSSIVFVGTGNMLPGLPFSHGTVYKSTDGGKSWDPSNTDLADAQVNALVVNPSRPDTVYAGTDKGLFKSTNGGQSWSPIRTDKISSIVIPPNASDILYAGTLTGVFKSIDEGANWEPASDGLINTTILSLAANPTAANQLYAGTDGGIHSSGNAGQSWNLSSRGVHSTQIQAIAVAPSNPQSVYVGTQHNGMFRSSDRGASWLPINNQLPGYMINAVAVDPTAATTVYASIAGKGIYKSADAGANWQPASNPQPSTSVRTLAIDPLNATTIFAGTSSGLFRSINGGTTWANSSAGLTNTFINDLAISPDNPNRLYVGTDKGVFKSIDGGINWAVASIGLPSDSQILALSLDPGASGLVYAGTSNGLYKSVNSGASWSQINLQINHVAQIVNALAVDPLSPTRIYAGTIDGVYSSTNSGASWAKLSEVPSDLSINSVVIDPLNPSNIYVGTDGGAVFTRQSDVAQTTVYARVVDPNGQPFAGAQIYQNGRPVTDAAGNVQVTDSGGSLELTGLQPGDTLVALAPVYEQPTMRKGRTGTAYRIYTSNMGVGADGSIQPFTVANPIGQQRLIARPERALILFDLLIAIEWDADDAYVGDLALAIDRAADYLYDATDGQMTFGQVTIVDKAEQWAAADIQISAKNIVNPHAHVGGIVDDDPAHIIRVGRFWNGNSGDQGAWSDPNGYRTLVHEFGHYALGLYDEYFGYDQVGNQLGAPHDASCTAWENWTGITPIAAASIMDYQYKATEFADAGRWSDECHQTAQHQLNRSEADWQTLARRFGDPSGANRWRLVTPDERAKPGNPVPGPAAIPSLLPFPKVQAAFGSPSPDAFKASMCYGGMPYRSGVWVTLYHPNGKAMDQGLTDGGGQITIFGAQADDKLLMISLDGKLWAQQVLPISGCIALQPRSHQPAVAGREAQGRSRQVAITSDNAEPYLRLWPTISNGQLDGLRLVMTHTQPSDSLTYVLTGPDNIGPSATMVYDASTHDHRVQVGFIPEALAGHAKVLGSNSGQYFELKVSYRIQHAASINPTNLFSNDGNLSLFVLPGALPLTEVDFLIATPWGLPGVPPSNLKIVGEAHEISASNNVTTLQQPGTLRLRYDSLEGTAFEQLAIYRWNLPDGAWHPLNSTIDEDHHEVVTTITELGVYALMGTPAKVYLPLIKRN